MTDTGNVWKWKTYRPSGMIKLERSVGRSIALIHGRELVYDRTSRLGLKRDSWRER